jgi:hypothetical protein
MAREIATPGKLDSVEAWNRKRRAGRLAFLVLRNELQIIPTSFLRRLAAGFFLATALRAGAFFAVAFLAPPFLAALFFAGAFFAALFFAGAFFAALFLDDFFAGMSFSFRVVVTTA